LLRLEAAQGGNLEIVKMKMKPYINDETINGVNNNAKLAGILE
jgi:hypothetical protein